MNHPAQGLRELGFQVAVTHLTQKSLSITEVDWTRPTAFVLGNENFGASAQLCLLLLL